MQHAEEVAHAQREDVRAMPSRNILTDQESRDPLYEARAADGGQVVDVDGLQR